MNLLQKLKKNAKPLTLATALFFMFSFIGYKYNRKGLDCVNLYEGKTFMDPKQIKELIIKSNLKGEMFNGSQSNGKLTRWDVNTPIKVYTGGVKRFDKAVENIVFYTKGLIPLVKVDSPTGRGINMIEGRAFNQYGKLPCGNVDDDYTPDGFINYDLDDSKIIKGRYFVHVGSSKCDDSKQGNRLEVVAEHELMHILGLDNHFLPGYDWPDVKQGIKNNYARAVLINIYQNKSGITSDQIKICSY